jgi:hypothetical protein
VDDGADVATGVGVSTGEDVESIVGVTTLEAGVKKLAAESTGGAAVWTTGEEGAGWTCSVVAGDATSWLGGAAAGMKVEAGTWTIGGGEAGWNCVA